MAYLDSADLVRRTKLRLARPSSDEVFTVSSTDDVLYDFGGEAQTRVCTQLAIFVPDAMWTVPTELSSSDGGYTYTFGTDTDAAAIFALGHFKLFENLQSIPDYPLDPGVDFTIEGTKIRIPSNTSRTFTDGGPYAQYIAPSNVIAAATQPTVPKIARTPMISDMTRRAFDRLLGPGSTEAAAQEAEFQRELSDLVAVIRTQAFQKGGATLANRPRSYWRMRRW